MDSLAILERGNLYPTPSAASGLESECPYCIARHITEYRSGDQAIMLHMQDAGRLLKYVASDNSDKVDSFEWLDEPGKLCRLQRDHWLTLPLEIVAIPFWLPPLSLRNCFIFDELAVWFCMESHCGTGFHWDDSRIIELARTCWEKRLPIDSSDFAKVLLAHGMPPLYQAEFEKLFDYSIATLVATKGRPALKKLTREISAGQVLYDVWKK